MYAITVKHDDGLTTHINIFFDELIDATRYCEGLRDLNSKFEAHDKVYTISYVGSNDIISVACGYVVKEYKNGLCWSFTKEEDSK